MSKAAHATTRRPAAGTANKVIPEERKRGWRRSMDEKDDGKRREWRDGEEEKRERESASSM